MTQTVKDHETLYKLMISQLRYDGLDLVATSLAKCCNLDELPLAPCNRLLEVFKLGLAEEKSGREPDLAKVPGISPDKQELQGLETSVKMGLDLEYEKDEFGTSPPVTQYETHYVTAHKGPVTAAAFTPDGRLCATGSVDTSIKIIDISRMLAKAAQSQAERQAERENTDDGGGIKNHPVIRTMYDHEMTVNTLKFHPQSTILVSGGEDRRVNFFDYTKSTVKKAYKCIAEVEAVRDVSIHPCGDYILVATDHPTIRLYDINTSQCFISPMADDQHLAPLTSVEYCPAANLYATASRDGSWKLWDGVSNRCVQTYREAHDTAEVTSVRFTKNSKFVLTSGRDGTAKLWELSTGRVINTYGGAVVHQNNHCPAVFNFTEDFVMFPDDKNIAVGCWDSRTGEKLQSLSSGHNNMIRHVVHSSCTPAFLSCSEDHRCRFWYCRGS